MRISDWSSDVCSSDLRDHPVVRGRRQHSRGRADPQRDYRSRSTITPAVLRLLEAMSREDVEPDEAEAVCDRFEVWVGDKRFHRETINRALRVLEISIGRA